MRVGLKIAEFSPDVFGKDAQGPPIGNACSSLAVTPDPFMGSASMSQLTDLFKRSKAF